MAQDQVLDFTRKGVSSGSRRSSLTEAIQASPIPSPVSSPATPVRLDQRQTQTQLSFPSTPTFTKHVLAACPSPVKSSAILAQVSLSSSGEKLATMQASPAPASEELGNMQTISRRTNAIYIPAEGTSSTLSNDDYPRLEFELPEDKIAVAIYEPSQGESISAIFVKFFSTYNPSEIASLVSEASLGIDSLICGVKLREIFIMTNNKALQLEIKRQMESLSLNIISYDSKIFALEVGKGEIFQTLTEISPGITRTPVSCMYNPWKIGDIGSSFAKSQDVLRSRAVSVSSQKSPYSTPPNAMPKVHISTSYTKTIIERLTISAETGRG